MRPSALALSVCLLFPALALADAAALAAKLDALYANRDDAAATKDTEATLSEALKESPNDYEILWRASRWKYWLSDDPSIDDRLKKQLGKEGWMLGDRASKANPDRPEGYYYAAIGMGSYSQAVGILKALGEGLEGQYNDRLDKAMKMDDAMDNSGPLVAKGRYYYELPWPKRDLGKSKELYEKVIARHPNHTRTHVYLAETLLKDGDAKGAKVEIDKALNGSVAYDPPDGRRMQRVAKPIAEKIQGELQ